MQERLDYLGLSVTDLDEGIWNEGQLRYDQNSLGLWLGFIMTV